MKRFMLFAAFAAALSARAQITTIGPFTGDQSDGYESDPYGGTSSLPMFGGNGNEVRPLPSNGVLIVASSWGFNNVYVTHPHSGGKFMGGAGCNYQFVFATAVSRFGGYFCTNADSSDAVATFYDAGGNAVGSLPVTAPAGNDQWTWNGWESTVQL